MRDKGWWKEVFGFIRWLAVEIGAGRVKFGREIAYLLVRSRGLLLRFLFFWFWWEFWIFCIVKENLFLFYSWVIFDPNFFLHPLTFQPWFPWHSRFSFRSILKFEMSTKFWIFCIVKENLFSFFSSVIFDSNFFLHPLTFQPWFPWHLRFSFCGILKWEIGTKFLIFCIAKGNL